MVVGVPREVKREEYRVALTPSGAAELRAAGVPVLVEEGAGSGSGYSDHGYRTVGAEILPRERLFGEAELIVKVKEPLPQEFPLFRPGQALFTYLHLAANLPLIEFLRERRVAAFAYETLEKEGGLPLLEPMSEVAGRMAPLVAASLLQRSSGGAGVLPTGLPGVLPARAVILGAGTVGSSAARVAAGIGMETVVLNRGIERLRRLDELSAGRIRTLPLQRELLAQELREADIAIGALLVPGGRTPVLVTREMLATMRPGAVIVDVSVDQGGCFATTRPTTHDCPTYVEEHVLHYCVANMPGAYPRSSTLALTNATLPYILLLATRGASASSLPELQGALNVAEGRIVHPGVAAACSL